MRERRKWREGIEKGRKKREREGNIGKEGTPAVGNRGGQKREF